MRFLEIIDDDILMQVTEEPVRGDTLLELILVKKDGLAADV